MQERRLRNNKAGTATGGRTPLSAVFKPLPSPSSNLKPDWRKGNRCIRSLGFDEQVSISNKNMSEDTYFGCGMERKYVLAGVVILLIVLISAVTAILAVTLRSAPTVIRVEPENEGKLAVGDTFVVNVTVENCVNVIGVQVDLRYDPTVLNATNIVEGPFLPSFRQTMPLIDRSSNNDTLPRSAGVYLADSLRGSGNGTDANGKGVLLTVTFKVVGQGSTELQLFSYDPTKASSIEGTYLENRNLNNILPELHNGSYGGSS
ncbi:MAG TPA: cohesin domain-containing protein [candidate division Zixibacteria bacterium]|nr:cohesin domain-containing protein [candidate division Zixibacteria bacterium]